jgi:prevent-host-death family protein
MEPPVVVNISRLHRETSAVVRQAAEYEQPVFVTQYACVAAVLLPRRMYDRLLRAAERNVAGSAQDPVASPAGPSTNQPAGPPANPPSGPRTSPLEGPLGVFGPLPPRTRFLTQKGLSVDADLAAFLMEEGEPVTPILERRREQDAEAW